MEVKVISIQNPRSKSEHQITVMEEECFKYYYETLRYSRKDFRGIGIGSRIFQHSLHHWYSEVEIENLRTMKASLFRGKANNYSNNIAKDFSRAFSEKDIEILTELNKIFPGILEASKDNYNRFEQKEALSKVYFEAYIELKNLETWLKDRTDKLRKSLRRNGISLSDNIKFNINKSEAFITGKLKEAGFNVRNQELVKFEDKSYYYDFFLEEFNLLIEIDGNNFHTGERDLLKDEVAQKKGYKLLRFKLTKGTKKQQLERESEELIECIKKYQ